MEAERKLKLPQEATSSQAPASTSQRQPEVTICGPYLRQRLADLFRNSGLGAKHNSQAENKNSPQANRPFDLLLVQVPRFLSGLQRVKLPGCEYTSLESTCHIPGIHMEPHTGGSWKTISFKGTPWLPIVTNLLHTVLRLAPGSFANRGQIFWCVIRGSKRGQPPVGYGSKFDHQGTRPCISCARNPILGYLLFFVAFCLDVRT